LFSLRSGGDNGPRVPYKAAVLSLALALFVSLVCATAVQLGFGAGFVSTGVAWATSCYATALGVALVGRNTDAPGPLDRIWVRVPVGLGAAALTLWLLRGPLLFDLPYFQYQTTGHTPFVVFPVGTALGLGLLALLKRLPRGSRPS
jgi:hypothetical protein